MLLDARIPAGPIETKWERTKFDMKLVNPANKRRWPSCSTTWRT